MLLLTKVWLILKVSQYQPFNCACIRHPHFVITWPGEFAAFQHARHLADNKIIHVLRFFCSGWGIGNTKAPFLLHDPGCNCYVITNKWLKQSKACRQTSNISRTLIGNKIVAHSDVVGASPAGAAQTTSSFSTSIDWTKTAARRDENI